MIRFSTTCLISWALTGGDDRLAGGELDLLVLILAQVADHVDHALRPARAGRCRAAATSPRREKSSSFSVISLQRKASF